jgi:hypothetical protein
MSEVPPGCRNTTEAQLAQITEQHPNANGTYGIDFAEKVIQTFKPQRMGTMDMTGRASAQRADAVIQGNLRDRPKDVLANRLERDDLREP